MLHSIVLSFLFGLNIQASDSIVYIKNTGAIVYTGKTETSSPIKNVQAQLKKAGVKLSGGLIAIANGNENWLFYNAEGKKLSDTTYASFQIIDTYGIAVKKGFAWGIMDFNGMITTPFIYAEIKKNGDILLGKELSKIEIKDSLLRPEKILAFDNITFLDNEYAVYEIAGKTGLLEYSSGKFITQPVYENIKKFNDSLFIVEKNKKRGLVNKQEKIVIPIEYEEVSKDTANFIKVKTIKPTGTQKREKYGIYSLTGRVIVPAKYDEIGLYTYGMYTARSGSDWGYVNSSGEVAIPFIFTKAEAFVKGIAPVARGSLFGVIDTKGSWVTFPEYASIEIVNDSLWIWNNGERSGFFDAIKRQFLPETYQEIKPVALGYFAILQNDNFGMLSPQRKLVLKPEFTSVKIYENEKIIVGGKGQYYSIFYLNGNLKVFMNYPFSKFSPYKGGMAMVVQKEKYGFIDKDGLLLVSTQYDESRSFSSGMAAIRIGTKWGFIDAREKILTMPYYDEVNDFVYGTAAVKKNAKYGFVDKTGREVTRTQYDAIELRPTGNHVIKLNNRFGLVNQSGIESVNPIYKDCIELTAQFLKVRLHIKYGLVDNNNKIITNQEYDDIKYSPTTGKFIFINKKEWQPVKR